MKRQHSKPNPARHGAQCSVCAHPQREEIDLEFVSWTSPALIATAYKLSRDAVYRHARAMNLFHKRQNNVRAALEKIIEQAAQVEVNASAVVSAVTAYAKINAAGQWIDRSEIVDVNQLFERMTNDELETYARTGELPEWFLVKPQQEVNQNAT